jgi:hypothetical protein
MAEALLYWHKLDIKDKWFERMVGKVRANRALFGCNIT